MAVGDAARQATERVRLHVIKGLHEGHIGTLPAVANLFYPWHTAAMRPGPAIHPGLDVPAASRQTAALSAELIAVLVAVTDGEPRVLTLHQATTLPSGPFAATDRSLQASLRARVERQTGHPLGYVEQLYTFADRDRTGDAGNPCTGPVIGISYLGLTREMRVSTGYEASWQGWYRYFPWEDQRAGPGHAPAALTVPLRRWADDAVDNAERASRRQRIALTFGAARPADGTAVWNEELVLQRYELLFEAGLVPEAGQPAGGTAAGSAETLAGAVMLHDHRRILATAIARLRAKIKYRPVIFELVPDDFTLLQLQRVFEAVAGRLLHKQNFRRLIDQQGLVEETGALATATGGRPAKLYRFKRSVLQERAVSGTKLPLSRSR